MIFKTSFDIQIGFENGIREPIAYVAQTTIKADEMSKHQIAIEFATALEHLVHVTHSDRNEKGVDVRRYTAFINVMHHQQMEHLAKMFTILDMSGLSPAQRDLVKQMKEEIFNK